MLHRLVIRLHGVLTAAEQHLVKTLQADKGRDLLKQVRFQLIETARPILEAMVQEATGAKVLSLHHDISTVTGEEVVLFTLAESLGGVESLILTVMTVEFEVSPVSLFRQEMLNEWLPFARD